MRLTKQTILITGGSSGIGKALTNQLVKAGNQLIIASRNGQSETDNPIALYCDLANPESVHQLVATLNAQSLLPSVLINNAAVQHTPRFVDQDFDINTIATEVTTNFTAPALLTALLLPTLTSHPQAAIVNLSSGLAIYPKTSSAVYCASKAAIHSLSQSLRYQLEETNIQVHEAIMPLVDTPMAQGRGHNKLSPVVVAEAIIRGVEHNKDEIYVGKARYLPLLSRLAPGMAKRILKNY